MKDDQKKAKILPDNHKRSLSVTARHVEKNISEIQRMLQSKTHSYKTEQIINDVHNDDSESVLKLLTILKNKNEAFFDELLLDKNILSERRILVSKISYIWTILCDSTANAMKGYGEVTPEQAKLIDKHINGMLETVDKIQYVLNK